MMQHFGGGVHQTADNVNTRDVVNKSYRKDDNICMQIVHDVYFMGISTMYLTQRQFRNDHEIPVRKFELHKSDVQEAFPRN